MNPLNVLALVCIAILSITSHEAAHGFVADRLGDSTARERDFRGRFRPIRLIGTAATRGRA